MSFPITPHGRRECLVAVASGAAAIAVLVSLAAATGTPALGWLAAIPLALIAFVLSFFRDPERSVPEGEGLVLSPADGTVTDVSVVPCEEYIGGRAMRVSIFLSVFNCHINRGPVSGTVEHVRYRPGEFVNAMRADSSVRNESNAIGLRAAGEGGPKVLVRQVSGAIARRIVCRADPGDEARRGERFGMIKFGSRTEVYFPEGSGFEPRVRVGDKVKGGLTVLGTLVPVKVQGGRP